MKVSEVEMSVFAQDIMKHKYSHILNGSRAITAGVKDGDKESWPNIAYRVTKNVMRPVGLTMRDKMAKDICRMISERKFMPGGRYLYASGRPYHQTQNCYEFSTEVVTSLGTKQIGELSGKTAKIMTSRGEWVDAEFRCFGEQRLYKIIMSFGQLKKTLYATANHSWRVAKNVTTTEKGRKHFQHKQNVDTIDLKSGDILWQVFGYGIDRTPVSPVGVQHGFVWGDGSLSTGDYQTTVRLCGDKSSAMKTYFDLFPQRQIGEDIEVSLLPSHFKSLVDLSYDRSYLLGWLAGYFAADGCVSKEGNISLTSHDRKAVQHVKDVCYLLGIGCNSIREGKKVSNLDGKEYTHYSVSFDRSTLTEKFFLREQHRERWLANSIKKQTYWKVESVEETDQIEPVYCAVVPNTHEFTLADNILTGNCLLMRVHDSREGWSELLHKSSMALMTGAGIGVDYSDLRHENAIIRRTGGRATGPIALMQMLNECGRGIMQGGSRRCLPSDAPVIMEDGSRKRIDEIVIGDMVHTQYGPRKVTNVFHQGQQEILKITTEHGECFSSENHKWLGTTLMRVPKWLQAKNLKAGWHLYFCSQPTPGGARLNLDWAYTLGYYLGNGCAYSSNRTHEVTFSIPNKHVTEGQIATILKGMEFIAPSIKGTIREGNGECLEIRFRSKDLVKTFQGYKKPHSPFNIPDEIWSSDIESRSAFLAGWLDADGSEHEGRRCRLSNKYASCLIQVKKLFETLGQLSSISGNELHLKAKQVDLFNSTVGKFSHKYKFTATQTSNCIKSEILSVKRIGVHDTYDIEVEDVHEFVAYNHISHNSAIWAGLIWRHPDIHKFIRIKNWSDDVKQLKLKDFNFPATLDCTNISVILDDEFFAAYENEEHPKHAMANQVYWAVVEQMLETAEPGFSVDIGKNSGENLRNACVTGDTEILTDSGYIPIQDCVGKLTRIWNGFEWSEVVPKVTGTNQEIVSVLLSDGRSISCTKDHKFITHDGREVSINELEQGAKLLKHTYPVIENNSTEKPWAYTQGFISADGMDNYSWFWVYDTKYMCLGRMQLEHTSDDTYNRIRVKPSFEKLPKNFVPFYWSNKDKLDWLAGLMDGDGSALSGSGVQIGSVEIEFLLGVQKLLTLLGCNSKVHLMREAGVGHLPNGRGAYKDYNQRAMYRLLISGTAMRHLFEMGLRCERLDLESCLSKNPPHKYTTVVSVDDAGVADEVYCFNEPVRHYGCFNGVVTGQCTEVTSHDDSDICNLGSFNLARIESIEEFERLMPLGVAFLLAGTVYSDVPYPMVDRIRSKNRRLGLGLMGVHEWLLKRGKSYGPDTELGDWMKEYAKSTDIANKIADDWELSRPVKTRAIAPTGTISIVAETTGGLEPIFCVAFKRRYLKGSKWCYQYVVDPTAKRLIKSGVSPDSIEDAYILAQKVERRVSFQAWIQQFVDHGISSTINLPSWGTKYNNSNTVRPFGNMLMKYLPALRGITCYPDGARGGQPLVPCDYEEAIKHTGFEMVEEPMNVCNIAKGGDCGD